MVAGLTVLCAARWDDTAAVEPTAPLSPPGGPSGGPVRPSGGRLVVSVLAALALCALGGLGVLITPLVAMGSAGCSGQEGCGEAWNLITLTHLGLMLASVGIGLGAQWALARRWSRREAVSWEPLAIIALSATPLAAYVVVMVVGSLIEKIFIVA